MRLPSIANTKFCRFGGLILFSQVVTLTVAHADFTISGVFSPANATAPLRLERENIEDKSRSVEGEIPLAANGAFHATFKGEPGLFSLLLPDQRRIALAIDDGQELHLHPDSNAPDGYTVSGSPDTDALRAYEAFRKDSLVRLVYPPRAALNAAKDRGDAPETLAPLSKKEVDGYAAHRRELNDFTLNHVGTSIALYATSLRWDPDYRLVALDRTVAAFAKEHPDTAIAQRMRDRIHSFQKTALGAIAAPLSGQSLDGTTHTLEDFRGQFVLVDFWASWCVPCRVENRLYTKLLKEYADSDFAIFAVNLDDSRSAWGTATRRDRVTWPQISDSLGWNSPLAAAYNVSALPMSFLLDPEGRIIGRNLRGEALEDRLAELLQ